jgi:5-methylcytosine-specific restriction endonuclease McrA
MKECAKCHIYKDLSSFGKMKKASDGFHPWCKQCVSNYKMEHKPDEKAARQRYKHRHPQRYWAHSSLANHKWGKRNFDCKLTLDELEQFAKGHSTCAICGKKVKWTREEGTKRNGPDAATLDRVNNEKLITIDNIQILCYSCNTTKSNRTMQEFIEFCEMVASKHSGEVLV